MSTTEEFLAKHDGLRLMHALSDKKHTLKKELVEANKGFVSALQDLPSAAFEAQDSDGLTVLMHYIRFLCRSWNYRTPYSGGELFLQSVGDQLLRINLNVSDSRGNSALSHAIAMQNPEIVAALVRNLAFKKIEISADHLSQSKVGPLRSSQPAHQVYDIVAQGRAFYSRMRREEIAESLCGLPDDVLQIVHAFA